MSCMHTLGVAEVVLRVVMVLPVLKLFPLCLTACTVGRVRGSHDSAHRGRAGMGQQPCVYVCQWDHHVDLDTHARVHTHTHTHTHTPMPYKFYSY